MIIDAIMCLLIGGTLRQLFGNYKGLHASVVAHYTNQLVDGVKYLHDNRIIHRNLCGELIVWYTVCILPSSIIW